MPDAPSDERSQRLTLSLLRPEVRTTHKFTADTGLEMDSAEATRVTGQADEQDRTRTDKRRGPTFEISHDLRALAGRRPSVTNLVAAIKDGSLGVRPDLRY